MKAYTRALDLGLSTPISARPFLKWAGGKSQLLKQLTALLPKAERMMRISRYIEPFLGGGAFFFYLAQNYQLEDFILSDINSDLILTYRTIQSNVEDVIDALDQIQSTYIELDNEMREKYFYEVRRVYNEHRSFINYNAFSKSWVERTSQMIFLNRTCFNGLFRVNAKGGFNVPFGDYKNPTILDVENLLVCSQLLQRAKIYQEGFQSTKNFVNSESFVYFDPPYRPLNKTSNFTSYSQYYFGDTQQSYLAEVYRQCDRAGAYLMLSNSDPTNHDPNDTFFEQLYAGYFVHRVKATRMINSVASKRGNIDELVITNYAP